MITPATHPLTDGEQIRGTVVHRAAIGQFKAGALVAVNQGKTTLDI
jgi:hypothetical protein